MPAGNKKKKRPVAANPVRGFATTSLQSKAKVEAANDEKTEASSDATPDTATQGASPNPNAPVKQDGERDLSELSPEEFATHLENSELQLFVEKNAARVRKEASRQVSRLQTDKRLLRGQADFMSVKDWLPEELMQQIVGLALEDLERETELVKRQDLPKHDDLVSKVWSLRLSLTDLDLPIDRINQAISFVLKHPPGEDSGGLVWGLLAALDWLAIHCGHEELAEYDVERQKRIIQGEDAGGESSDDSSDRADNPSKKHDSPLSDSKGESTHSTPGQDIDVSDVESDLEPDELLSTYMRTKARLYDINPNAADLSQGKKGGKASKPSTTNPTGSAGERKLAQKLQKIESDVLFDKRQADAEWASKRVELAREAADRRKLQLEEDTQTEKSRPNGQAAGLANASDEAEQMGNQLLQESEHLDGDDILGGMFSAVPGVSEPAGDAGTASDPSMPVTVRDFGRLTGINPKRILEEACRARDSRCKISYKQVSPTAYSCRHAVYIEWSSAQDIIDSEYLSSIVVKSTPKRLVITMLTDAAPEAAQSEAYAATVALFLIFSEFPKEEKAHMRLPPAYRELWTELTQKKREHQDSQDRQTVKEIRSLVESESPSTDDEDDDVVFNANLRRLNGNASGTSTPTSRPLTPRPDMSEASEALKDIWTRKSSTESYQRMLLARTNLPMFHAKATAMEAIARNQVTIVVGDTGSGKSTQVPQFILEHELSQGRQCKIYCTEPRRISAISLAQRVSEELGEQKGDVGTARSLVGYAIRLESQTAVSTRLVYATVGIVLRMLENADGLKGITHLVLDEVHERSIDTDFLLIVLRTLINARPDLKVILMSATVDAQKFSNYLDGAPIISVPGRTFPVGARFLEDAIELTGHTNEDASARDTTDEDDADVDQPADGKSDASQSLSGYSAKTRKTLATYDEYRIDHALIVKLLEKVAYDAEYKDFSKAILVFLPGIAEIRQLNDMLVGHPSFSKGWRVHALHSTFSSEDQQAAFEIPTNGVRKIVLATNIAETGITIPDVTCVIDTGKHREMRFDERRQMSRLIQSFIARANAKQRRGRAGRVQEGLCFHLFTKHRFENLMIDQQTPEMLRLSLQDLVMRVKICKLGNIEDALSQAIDPPSSKNIRRAIDALVEVGALTETEQLTPLGSQLAKMPLDAQLGKLILLGASFGCLDFAATVAATLSSKTPFLSPMHARKQADSVRLGFKRGDSDLLTTYNAYTAWRKVCTTPGMSEFTFCNKNFLSPQNLANIEDLKAQLLTALVDANFVSFSPQERNALTKVRPGSRQRNFVTLPEKYTKNDTNDILTSSVAAWSFYPKIVKREGKGWRNIANNQSLGLHPTSVNKQTLPQEVKFLSFYSIMQSSSRFTNAQETSAVSDFALVLLGGEAVFHMFAGVIVVDGNRSRLKVRDWRTMIALKTLRARAKEVLGRQFRYPGREMGERLRRWREVVERIFGRKVEGRA